jgi:hypothetical protein
MTLAFQDLATRIGAYASVVNDRHQESALAVERLKEQLNTMQTQLAQ